MVNTRGRALVWGGNVDLIVWASLDTG